MVKRLNATLVGVAIGLFLVGCSILDLRHPVDTSAAPPPPVAGLTPGVASVTVERLSNSQATLRWQSPWNGRTEIYYGKTPLVLPLVADRSPLTYESFTTLTNLEPNTRYYFQVETHTPLGAARSAVLSFLTAPTPPTPVLDVVHEARVPLLNLAVRHPHHHPAYAVRRHVYHLAGRSYGWHSHLRG